MYYASCILHINKVLLDTCIVIFSKIFKYILDYLRGRQKYIFHYLTRFKVTQAMQKHQ